MAWTTPKTDWYGATVNGVYTGDYFNAVDYNRIKNNIVYLTNLAYTLYPKFDVYDLGDDRTVKDYVYLDDMTNMISNLNTINANTINKDYELPNIYTLSTFRFEDLNEIENMTLDLYKNLTNQYEGRRMFTWNFGIGRTL